MPTTFPPGLSIFTYVAVTTLMTAGYHMTRVFLKLIGQHRNKITIKQDMSLQSFCNEQGNILCISIPGSIREDTKREYKIHCMPGETVTLGEFTTPLNKTRDILHARVYDADADEYHTCTKAAKLLCGPKGDFFGRDIPLRALFDDAPHIQSGHLEYTTSDGYLGGRRILGVAFTTKKKCVKRMTTDTGK